MQGPVTPICNDSIRGEDHGWAGLGKGKGFGGLVVEVFGFELSSQCFEEVFVDVLQKPIGRAAH